MLARPMRVMDQCGLVNSGGAAVGVLQSNALLPIRSEWWEALILSISVIAWLQESPSTRRHSLRVLLMADSGRPRESYIVFSSVRSCRESHMRDCARFSIT